MTKIVSRECKTWFTRATKKRVGFEALFEAIQSNSLDSTHSESRKDSNSNGRLKQDENIKNTKYEEQSGLKNVRWSIEEDGGYAIEHLGSELISS